MNYTIYCRFLLSLFASIFILNINISFVSAQNYYCFSLSKNTEIKEYKLVGVKKRWARLWAMPDGHDHSFKIMDKAGKNSIFIKTAGKYESICTRYGKRMCSLYGPCLNECLEIKQEWTGHITAIRTSAGKGLNVQGCGLVSKEDEYMNNFPCCKLTITDKK